MGLFYLFPFKHVSNETGIEEDFFKDLIETSPVKTTCLTISFFGIFFGPVFIYSIIWYEKYGSDNKRTILNMYASMFCWEFLKFILFVQIPDTMRYIVGPLHYGVCYTQTLVRSSTTTAFLVSKSSISLC